MSHKPKGGKNIIDIALHICRTRASKVPNNTFNEDATRYRLLGIQLREGDDAVIQFAKTAKIPTKHPNPHFEQYRY